MSLSGIQVSTGVSHWRVLMVVMANVWIRGWWLVWSYRNNCAPTHLFAFPQPNPEANPGTYIVGKWHGMCGVGVGRGSHGPAVNRENEDACNQLHNFLLIYWRIMLPSIKMLNCKNVTFNKLENDCEKWEGGGGAQASSLIPFTSSPSLHDNSIITLMLTSKVPHIKFLQSSLSEASSKKNKCLKSAQCQQETGGLNKAPPPPTFFLNKNYISILERWRQDLLKRLKCCTHLNPSYVYY